MGEHRAAGENLDVIDSIMRELANDLAHFPRAVGFAVVHVPRQRDVGSEAGIGAGAAGNCDVSAGDVHAWTDDIAAIDRIAQSNISESAVGAYIAHRGGSPDSSVTRALGTDSSASSAAVLLNTLIGSESCAPSARWV